MKYSKWKRKDLIMLFERLELYLSAGMNLDQTLRSLSEGWNKKQMNSILRARTLVFEGSTVSKAFFLTLGIPPGLVGLIQQGELSGRLAQSFGSAKEMLEKEEALRSEVSQAMVYPLVIGFCASGLTLGLMRGVMPQIVPMLKGMNVKLPLLTRIVIAVSDSLLDYGLIMAISIIVFIFAFMLLYRKILSFRNVLHECILRFPLLGGVVRRHSLALFLSSLGRMLDSGMPLEIAYSKAVEPLSILPLRRMLFAESENISKGISLSKAFTNIQAPRFIAPLIDAGESSGALSTSILRTANILERDISKDLKRLTSLLEPSMMVAMGATVGAIALSIMLPIYDISKTLQR